MARLKGLISALPLSQRVLHPGEPAPDRNRDPSSRPLEIGNARVLQAALPSAAACFQKHGFALLDHPTSVRQWRRAASANDEVAEIYRPEIDALLRARLFTGSRVEIDQSLDLLCRGREDEVIYGDRVHQDFGLTIDDLLLNLGEIPQFKNAAALQARYAQDDVVGCVAISLWRPIEMVGPIRHMPLALCDCDSVDMADVLSFSPDSTRATHHIELRFNAGQRWYHYPEMRHDEVLAFKLFECRKDDAGASRLRSVFHAAFEDPATPEDAERRLSCEHRAIVTLLRD